MRHAFDCRRHGEKKIDERMDNHDICRQLGVFYDELLTDKEVAHILKVSRRTLQDYRNNGILSYIQVGGKILYRTSDVQRTIMSGFKEAYRLRDSG